jgi:hypothetical protein
MSLRKQYKKLFSGQFSGYSTREGLAPKNLKHIYRRGFRRRAKQRVKLGERFCQTGQKVQIT